MLPHAPGTYRFRDDRGRVLYLGRAADLRRRVGSYWGDLRDRRHLRRMVPQIARIEALVCASEHEAAWAERMLLEHRMPRWNRIAGGMENPVWVGVDRLTPGLVTAHEVAERRGLVWYGPYLGGTATRLAVAALERCYPMAYARSGLTGTERDLARIHGVGEVDAARLLAAVEAVLRREQGAIDEARGLLLAKRAAAVADELYEVAGRIHDELGGLDWIVAPCRLVGTEDLDLAASVGGVRVALTFRGGRLRTWDQSLATAPVSPPPEWHELLVPNAELASRLNALPVRGVPERPRTLAP